MRSGWWTALALASACQGDPDCTSGPCEVSDGTYGMVAPSGDGPFPVVFRLHGLNGAGSELAQEPSLLQDEAEARGIVLVFPDGVDGRWNHNRVGKERDDVAFFQQVLDDVAERVEVDRARTAMSGHSVGGTMTWTLACEAPQGFGAFYASSGGPFRPLQEACSGQAVSMVHTHGLNDRRTVLDERTADAIGFLVEEGACAGGESEADGPLSCTVYAGCRGGAEVRLCTHDGGHSDAAGWEERMLDGFERAWGGSRK